MNLIKTTVCTVLSLLCISSTFATFTSQSITSLDKETEAGLEQLIDSVYDPYVTKHTTSDQFREKLLTIRNTLVNYLNTTQTSSTTFYALEYLVYRIDLSREELLETLVQEQLLSMTSTPSTNTSTSQDQSSETQNTEQEIAQEPEETSEENQTPSHPPINVNTYYQGNKNLLAGTTSNAVLKYELIAQLEGVLVDEIALHTNNQDFERAISKVTLYDESGHRIAEKRPNGSSVTFNNLQRNIPTGQTDIYVTLTTKPVGYNISTPQTSSFTPTIDIQEAYGVISGNEYPLVSSTPSETISIVPTILTHVLLTDSWNGRDIDTRLFPGEHELGIVVIGNKTGSNTSTQNSKRLQTQLQTLTLIVQDNTVSGNILQSLSLAPLDGGTKITGSPQGGGEILFDLSSLGNDALLHNEEEHAYIITAEIATLDQTTQESISLRIAPTNNGGLTYSSNDPTSPIISSLNLQVEPTNKITLTDG